MSIQYARDIVQRLGPGRIHLDRARHDRLAQELALIGCEVRDLSYPGDGGAVMIDWPEDGQPASALAQAARHDTLILRCAEGYRPTIDSALFAAGWRRHPAGMLPGESGGWNDAHLPATSYYQRAPAGSAGGPLRATGVQADATIARFAQASHHVRAGDTVLVDSAHAQDGIAILAALSRGAHFATAEGIVGTAEAPFRLDAFADNSLDLIVAFEPPAENWQIALAEYARVLRLDGRLIVGWPARLNGESTPPGWEALILFAEQLFIVESRYAQNEAGRALYPVDLGTPGSDWLILVACADPLDGASRRDGYVHPGFPAQGGHPQPELVDFTQAYDNPWLYRSMVQLGERIADQGKLAQLAECVIGDSQPASADRGAAIAVLGYRVLEMRMTGSVPAMLAHIDSYMAATAGTMCAGARTAHALRWRVSLAFLAGRLCELAEDRDGALRWFDAAAGEDWSAFSPILATKTVGACFFAGRLRLAQGDKAGAEARFRRGVAAGQRAAAADHTAQIGDPDHPLPFYFQELAEVIDMTAQCANALFHMPLWDRDPGLYWRQVDVRRFGLANWALDLERENDRLRRMR